MTDTLIRGLQCGLFLLLLPVYVSFFLHFVGFSFLNLEDRRVRKRMETKLWLIHLHGSTKVNCELDDIIKN